MIIRVITPAFGMIVNTIAHRAQAAIAAVLPRTVEVLRGREGKHSVDLEFNGHCIEVKWLGEGGLRQIRELIARRKERPDVVVARRISPGGREALSWTKPVLRKSYWGR